MRIFHGKFHKLVVTCSVTGACVMSMLIGALPASATERVVPWECSGFGEEAQSRCIRTFAELQEEKIEQLENELKIQQQAVQQLQQQVTRQASVTATIQQKLSRNHSLNCAYNSIWSL